MAQHERYLRAACIQMTTIGDMSANIAEVDRLVRQAVSQGAQWVATPENSFYMRETDKDDVPLYPMDSHPGVQHCRALARELGIWLLVGSAFIPASEGLGKDGRWYNRSILINAAGAIVLHYDKIHLFDATFGPTRAYYESTRICPGEQVAVAVTPWGKLGLTICYDIRFPYLYRDIAQYGAEMIAVPAAFARVTGKAHWHVLLRARAIENGAYILAPAQCGVHPGGRKTYGHALMVNPWGEVLAEASAEAPGVIVADLDMAYVAEVRGKLPTLTHDRAYMPLPDYVI